MGVTGKSTYFSTAFLHLQLVVMFVAFSGEEENSPPATRSAHIEGTAFLTVLKAKRVTSSLDIEQEAGRDKVAPFWHNPAVGCASDGMWK